MNLRGPTDVDIIVFPPIAGALVGVRIDYADRLYLLP